MQQHSHGDCIAAYFWALKRNCPFLVPLLGYNPPVQESLFYWICKNLFFCRGSFNFDGPHQLCPDNSSPLHPFVRTMPIYLLKKLCVCCVFSVSLDCRQLQDIWHIFPTNDIALVVLFSFRSQRWLLISHTKISFSLKGILNYMAKSFHNICFQFSSQTKISANILSVNG